MTEMQIEELARGVAECANLIHSTSTHPPYPMFRADQFVSTIREHLAGRPAIQQDDVLRCGGGCGRPYGGESWIDVILPDDQWLLIDGAEGGVLCGACIVDRAAQLPGACVMYACVVNVSAAQTASRQFQEWLDKIEFSANPKWHGWSFDEFLARPAVPLPMVLHCPGCGGRHIDEGEFATKVHHTHACQFCGLVWRPGIVPTVGVQFLPGFKNVLPLPSLEESPAEAQPRNSADRPVAFMKFLEEHNPQLYKERHVDSASKFTESESLLLEGFNAGWFARDDEQTRPIVPSSPTSECCVDRVLRSEACLHRAPLTIVDALERLRAAPINEHELAERIHARLDKLAALTDTFRPNNWNADDTELWHCNVVATIEQELRASLRQTPELGR